MELWNLLKYTGIYNSLLTMRMYSNTNEKSVAS